MSPNSSTGEQSWPQRQATRLRSMPSRTSVRSCCTTTHSAAGPSNLVHFAMLVALGADEPARIHARAVLEAGGTVADLYGVAATAAVTGGMPAYGRALNYIQHALTARSPQTESDPR